MTCFIPSLIKHQAMKKYGEEKTHLQAFLKFEPDGGKRSGSDDGRLNSSKKIILYFVTLCVLQITGLKDANRNILNRPFAQLQKYFPHHAMKAYKDSGGIPPLIFKQGARRRCVVNFTPRSL